MVRNILSIAGVITVFVGIALIVLYSTTITEPAVAEADFSIAYGAINAPYLNTCMSLPRNLSVGSRGDDVAELQAYLVGLRYPGSGTWMITGYYGEVTKTVVATLQRERGLPVSGNLDTTTRALLAADCSSMHYTTTPSYFTPAEPIPVVYQYVYAYPYAAQLPPPPPPPAVITDVSGPSTIALNQPGNWIVDVRSPANTNSTLSVEWSDSHSARSAAPAVTHTVYKNQTFTFAHTFVTPGIHYVTFTISDSLGRKTSKTILVTVADRNYPFY